MKSGMPSALMIIGLLAFQCVAGATEVVKADDVCMENASQCGFEMVQLRSASKAADQASLALRHERAEVNDDDWVVPPVSPTEMDAYGTTPQVVQRLTSLGIPNVKALAAWRDPNFMKQGFGKLPGIDSLWGDNGSAVQPGYGGIKNYNVVEITPGSEGVKLYHMGNFDDHGGVCGTCDIWWGTHWTYKATFVQASINVQTCWDFSAVVECTFTEPFKAIIGQGWPSDKDDYMYPRACLNPDGSNATQVAGALKNMSFPPPDDTNLQVILPGCDVASHCVACPINAEDVVGSFGDPSKCKEVKDLDKCPKNQLQYSRAQELQQAHR